jgi:hypothetical protein
MTNELIVNVETAAEMSPEARILHAARGPGHTWKGDWDEVFELLTEYWIDPSTIICAKSGYSLLTLAAIEPAPEACERLIKLGASPENGGTVGARSALTMMVWLRDRAWNSKHRKIVALLAEHTVNHQDSDGKTALMFASTGAGGFGSKRGNLRIINQLISSGADPSLTDRRGRTALTLAVASNDASRTSSNDDVVQLLESYSVEYAAKKWFAEKYRVKFSDSGEMNIMSGKESVPPRAIRKDARIGTITKKIEDDFRLPEGSVALVDGKGKLLRNQDTIETLRKRHKQ